ncbi:Fe(3+) ABC transporter substrate-binding protein [Ferrimonas sp. YFM]|uniref:Fe(3+) ABC transporter substrate-binding protein n=1 Tax=Ferrimonas sp. YFM TaxID=3028878 RepID=UPI00257450A3|nr:Fe(3+) ABC transporter substrate-binding protein [Ferrimonas sp. YFM]BDY04434.1 iron deficiency-induced protein A [Ferrimonas sp. YFM]
MQKLLALSLLMPLALTPSLLQAEELNIYSSRKEALIKPLLDKFSEQSGIKVNLVTGKDDALITRLKREGNRSPADILITADAGRLHRAKAGELLQPMTNSDALKQVPANLKDQDNQWVGLTMRARPIFYVKGKVSPDELSTYEALTDAKWQGRICIRSSSNIYNQSLMASLIDADGADKAQAFATGLVTNMARPPAGGDTDQLRAAAAGVCDIAIANTYYYGRLANSDDASNQKVVQQLGLFWPNQADRGTHVNVSGIGITRSAKNQEAAAKLIDFMLTEEAQNWYAQVNNEYPVLPGVSASKVLASWGEFKADDISLNRLGTLNRQAVEIMDRAGWK